MKELILSEENIAEIVSRLGEELTRDLKDETKPPVFLCVMKGAMPFYSDLIKKVNVPIVCDYIQLSSYEGMSSTGKVTLARDISTDVTDRTVVVVEDIVDTGLSMAFLIKHIEENFKPKRILICALFDKKIARKNQVHVDYCGVTLPEGKFLVGYGLDYRQLLRNVPYVYVPSEEEIAEFDEDLDD